MEDIENIPPGHPGPSPSDLRPISFLDAKLWFKFRLRGSRSKWGKHCIFSSKMLYFRTGGSFDHVLLFETTNGCEREDRRDHNRGLTRPNPRIYL